MKKRDRTSGLLGSLLRRHGLTREAVAERLFVSEDTIDNWCIGRSALRPQMLTALAHLLREWEVPVQEVREFVRREAESAGLDLDFMAQYAPTPPAKWQDTVVVLLSDPMYVSQGRLLAGIWDQLMVKGQHQVVTLWDWSSREQHLAHLKSIREHRPAAIIIASQSGRYQEAQAHRSALAQDGICVLVCWPTSVQGEAAVGVDENHIVRYASEHLLSLGHRNIGALFVKGFPAQEERYKGFEETLTLHGIEHENSPSRWAALEDPHRTPRSMLDQTSLLRVATYLVQRDDVTALVAPSEVAAVSLLTALQQEGRRCPEDVSLLAVKPCSWTDALLAPPLTHIDPPYYELGRQAAGSILNKLDSATDDTSMEPAFVLQDYVICNKTGGTVARLPA